LGTRVLLHLGGVLEHLCERYSHHEVVDTGAVALGQIVSIVSVSVSVCTAFAWPSSSACRCPTNLSCA
jgi:hypothetical protein